MHNYCFLSRGKHELLESGSLKFSLRLEDNFSHFLKGQMSKGIILEGWRSLGVWVLYSPLSLKLLTLSIHGISQMLLVGV